MTNWTKEEEKYLIENYSKIDNKTLSKKLNKTLSSIMHKSKRLDVSKPEGYIEAYKKNPLIKYNYNHFTIDDLKKIALKYKTKTEFCIKNKTAHQKARRMGKDVFNDICSHMIDQQFSLPQLIMKFVLNKLFNKEGEYNTRKIIAPYELDLYYKDFNLAFEYDGKKWHKNNLNDSIKNNICKSKNITLIRIKENKKDKPFDDVINQIIDNLEKINKISKNDFTKENILSIELNTENIFSSILNEESINKIISKYIYYKDFRKNENALYMRLKKRRLLHAYTKNLIRDDKDKYKNKNKTL